MLRQKKNKKKFSIRTIIWIGFNYTCGMAFPLAFASLITSKKEGIGLWVFLIIFGGSFLAGIMGYGYAKLSRYFARSSGASYTFVRGTFGRFWGFLIGLMQYFVMPLAVCSMILSMISINFVPIIGKNAWGPYTTVYLNLIGIFIFIFFSSCIFFGLKYFKLFINISGILKWGASFIIIVFVLGLACLSHFDGFNKLANQTTHLHHINFFTLNSAFVTFFYFYAGFETYSTITKNVKDPVKTIPRSILWVTILTFSFYVIVLSLFVGALPAISHNHAFSNNPVLDVGKKAAATVGIILVITSMISLKINAAVQSGLFASSMLEPLAIETYISPRLSYLTSEKISNRSAFINIIITVIITFLLAILPVLAIGGHNKNVNYAQIIGMNSAVLLMQYFLVAMCILKLYFKKKILLKWWEIALFVFVWFFLGFELTTFFINIGLSISQFNVAGSRISSIMSMVELAIFLGFILFIVVFYYFHYLPIYRRRSKQNPQLQAKLDKIFVISKLANLERSSYYELANLKTKLKEEWKKNLDSISSKYSKIKIKEKEKREIRNIKQQIKLLIKKHRKEIVNIHSAAKVTDDWPKINLSINIILQKIKNLKQSKIKKIHNLRNEINLFYKFKKQYKSQIKTATEKRYQQIKNYIINFESQIEFIN